MSRRTVVGMGVAGVLLAGSAAPALAAPLSADRDREGVCVVLSGDDRTGPPALCVWVPLPPGLPSR